MNREFATIKVEDRGGGLLLMMLNRPEVANALNTQMGRDLLAFFDDINSAPAQARSIVLSGAGERAFCAGGDIRRLYDLGRAGDHAAQLTFWREEYQLDRRIKTYPKPIVVLADGITMGGGVGIMSRSVSGCSALVSRGPWVQ